MKVIAKLAFVFLVPTVLASCQIDAPVLSACDATTYDSGSPTKTWALGNTQLETISLWFSQRSSGWALSHATYAPKLLLSCKGADNSFVSINIVRNLVVLNSSGQYSKQLTDADVTSLRVLIDPKPKT
jgi:hypothetical protein